MPLNAHVRKARIAHGFDVNPLPCLHETTVARQTTPHPASPVAWTEPDPGTAGCLANAAWANRRPRHA